MVGSLGAFTHQLPVRAGLDLSHGGIEVPQRGAPPASIFTTSSQHGIAPHVAVRDTRQRPNAGARIRSADLLITNPGGTMSEAPVFGFFQYNPQGTAFPRSAVFSSIGCFSIAT